jgi:hypothetical protein
MKKKLKFNSGQGFSYASENGVFEVKATIDKKFTKLSEARKYYESLNEEKAIWDMTLIPRLLECHTYE